MTTRQRYIPVTLSCRTTSCKACSFSITICPGGSSSVTSNKGLLSPESSKPGKRHGSRQSNLSKTKTQKFNQTENDISSNFKAYLASVQTTLLPLLLLAVDQVALQYCIARYLQHRRSDNASAPKRLATSHYLSGKAFPRLNLNNLED